jgi:predicted permease
MRMARDAQFAVRTLRRSPGYTVLVVLTLALGIGASAAMFSVVRAVVLEPLRYAQPERLVRITSELRGFSATDTGVAAAELIDYQARSDLFAGVAGVMPVSANATGSDTPQRVEVLLVSWNYFAVLGVAPAHGRVFGPGDDTPGVANLAVVSDGFWRRTMGADPQAIGRTIVVDEDRVQVVGVMPPGFHHPGRTLQGEVDLWSPAGFRGGAPSRSRRRLEGALARLQPGVTLQDAQARLEEYGRTVRRQFPADYPEPHGWTPRVVPLQEDVVGAVATPMFVLLSGVGLLLLVACVNVAHLVLARMTSRRTEIAIRQALGASGRRLAGQLMIESALLASAGALTGVLVASWGLRALTVLAPPRLPRVDQVALDVTAIGAAAVVAFGVMVAFGLVPGLSLREAGTAAALKEGAGRASDGRGGRTRTLLVAAEVAIATVLLVAAGLLVRTVGGLLEVPVGFDTQNLVTARLTLPRPNDPSRAEYLDPQQRTALYREVLGRVSALPGVERAALSSQVPLGGFTPPLFVEIEGLARGGAAPVMHQFQVSPSFFDTLGVPLSAGRGFSGADVAGGEPVAIVSETAARRFWKGASPVGARMRLGPEAPWMTIVGVAGDVLNRRLTEPPQPILYRPIEQASDLTMAVLLRTRGDTPALGEQVAREIRAIDPDLPVYGVRTMDEWLATAVSQRRFLMRLLVTFGMLATVLALLGIYGVMAYSVSRRTREIGIRIALGAREADVAGMVLRAGLTVTAAGITSGLLASLVLSRYLRSQLFGIGPSDPLTLGLVLAGMLLVSLAAAYVPARRAARVDPLLALR